MSIIDLYDILTDKNKLKQLMSKLKRKRYGKMINNSAPLKNIYDDFEAWDQKLNHIKSILNMLCIPYHHSDNMSIIDLYNILMDKNKMKEIMSKLNNKAFW